MNENAKSAFVAWLMAGSLLFVACGGEEKEEIYTGPAGTTLGAVPGTYRDVGDFFRVKVIEFTANEGGGYSTCIYRGGDESDNPSSSPVCVFHDGTRDK